MNLTAWFAAPYLFPTTAGIYNLYIAKLFYPAGATIHFLPFLVFGKLLSYQMAVGILTLIFILLADLVLLFIPGNRDGNAYGPPPNAPPLSPDEVF